MKFSAHRTITQMYQSKKRILHSNRIARREGGGESSQFEKLNQFTVRKSNILNKMSRFELNLISKSIVSYGKRLKKN